MLRKSLSFLLTAVLAAVLCCPVLSAAAEVPEEGAALMFEDRIPEGYRKPLPEGAGRVERITYPSKDYAGSGEDVEKPALVYLPAGYSEDVPCDVLVLCHGIGGTENEWGFTDPNHGIRYVTDHLFAEGAVKNLIIVMPNGRSCTNYKNTSFDNMQAFYAFGQELRNDLLPYIDAHYSTWGSRTPGDLSAARDHRAMAGLSMGGMQTINIGLCECLDLFSAFGAFSAAPTSYPSAQIASELKKFPDNLSIRFFYSICGRQDGIAWASASAAAQKMPADSRLSEANWYFQEVPGEHSFAVWDLGLYNFLRLLGREQE